MVLLLMVKRLIMAMETAGGLNINIKYDFHNYYSFL